MRLLVYIHFRAVRATEPPVGSLALLTRDQCYQICFAHPAIAGVKAGEYKWLDFTLPWACPNALQMLIF